MSWKGQQDGAAGEAAHYIACLLAFVPRHPYGYRREPTLTSYSL